MPEQRHVFRLSRSLVVALPPQVQRHLGVVRGQPIYWYTVRKGEAVVTRNAARTGGHPEGLALQRELTAARAEIARLAQRNDARDRAMYAEGYALGRLDGEEVMRNPSGKRANALRRRRLTQHAWGARLVAGSVASERARLRERKIEESPAPILSSPSEAGEPDTSGAASPQVSHSEQT